MNKLLCIIFFAIQAASSAHANIHYIKKPSKAVKDVKDLYIDLIIKTVANTIYEDVNCEGSYQSQSRENGSDYPTVAHTMVGIKRLKNIKYCMKEILTNNIPGDCIETGVWRGGSTILMRAILKAYGDLNRKVWVADSFAGLPPPNPEKYPDDLGLDLSRMSYLAVSLEQVKSNFRKYDLLDNQVIFLEGLFSETLPTAPIEHIALLRLDGDYYESTMDTLSNLYPKLSVGGFVIIDDFGAIGACAKAVHDYRRIHNIEEPIKEIDFTGVFWKKEREI